MLYGSWKIKHSRKVSNGFSWRFHLLRRYGRNFRRPFYAERSLKKIGKLARPGAVLDRWRVCLGNNASRGKGRAERVFRTADIRLNFRWGNSWSHCIPIRSRMNRRPVRGGLHVWEKLRRLLGLFRWNARRGWFCLRDDVPEQLSHRTWNWRSFLGGQVRGRSLALRRRLGNRGWYLLGIAALSLIQQHPIGQRGFVWHFSDKIGIERATVAARLQHEPRRLWCNTAKRLENPLHCGLIRLLCFAFQNMHQHPLTSDFVIGDKSLHPAGGERFQKLVFFSEFHSWIMIPFG